MGWKWAALTATCLLAACGGGSHHDDFDAAPEPPDANVPPDTTPPGPVTDLVATPGAPGAVHLTWTNPTDADFAGVIVVRRLLDPVAGTPADGTTYGASDTLGAGEVVVYAGTDAAFDDTEPPGIIQYAAYARDGAANWSTPAARASAVTAHAAETATLTVAVATPGVTVTQQPPDYTLDGTATYDAGTQTLTVSLNALSGFARSVFAPKAEITAVDQGAVTGDGTLDTFPYVRLGNGIGIGGTGAGQIVITGVDGTVDPVHVDLTIVDHPMGVMFGRYNMKNAYELIDTGTMSSMGTVACDALLYVDTIGAGNNGNCPYRAGGLTHDARHLYTGHRSLPVVRDIDPATNEVLGSLQLDAGVGAVRAVALSPDDRTLFALLTIGGHAYQGSDAHGAVAATIDQVLVEIDAATLTETSRVTVASSAVNGDVRLSSAAVSPDGTRVAVSEMRSDSAVVHLYDTATLAEIQAIDVSSAVANNLKRVVYSPSGDTLYVAGVHATGIAAVDTTSFAVTPIALTNTADNLGSLVVDAAGKVYVSYTPTAADQPSLSVIDGTTVTQGPVVTDQDALALGLFGGDLWVASQNSQMYVYDSAMVQVGAGFIQLENTPNHDILFTPF